MPTYVYRFVDTGETIEVQQSFDDAPLTEAAHPETGALLPVKKVFTPVGITFKGGGFYKTDSRGSGRSTSTGSSDSSSSTPSSSASSSSESSSSTASSASTSSGSTSSSGNGSSTSAPA
jgi:predicted nucleic acid-binding Zn ribbon protein